MDETGRIVAERYECLEKIGRGASARVYRALDRNTHQLLALKILAGGNKGDLNQQKQFRRELEALKKLKSPFTVRLVDAGEDGDDLYLAMEYVTGQSLQELLQSQAPLDPKRACHLMLQLLKALEEAHHKGIIHRDLKPANMLIQLEGSGEHLRLGDFGIARMLGMTTFSGDGQSTGTPYYMSPEQVEGGDVRCESDLYAVGVVLYEMLVGRPPFEGDWNSVLAAHIRRPVSWPSLPKVPRNLRLVVEKAMAKKPDARFRSAQSMREAIEKWVYGASIPMQYREDRRGWWIAGMLLFSGLALLANIDGTMNFISNARKWGTKKKKKPRKKPPLRGARRPPPPPRIAAALAPPRRAPVQKPKGPSTQPKAATVRPVRGLSHATQVYLPPGGYTRGSPLQEKGREGHEHPHPVKLSRGFWLWQKEVTRAQFHALMGAAKGLRRCPLCPASKLHWHQAAAWTNALSRKHKLPLCFQCTGAHHSVLRCQKAPRLKRIIDCRGWRLPTDAEWEYAYRAGTQSAFYNGPLSRPHGPDPGLKGISWFKSNSGDLPHAVGQKNPNGWGLYDMAGNVWEWVYDDAMAYPRPPHPLLDPIGPTTGPKRIQRGGSYFDDPSWHRAAARLTIQSRTQSPYAGFRPARTHSIAPGTPAPKSGSLTP